MPSESAPNTAAPSVPAPVAAPPAPQPAPQDKPAVIPPLDRIHSIGERLIALDRQIMEAVQKFTGVQEVQKLSHELASLGTALQAAVGDARSGKSA